MCCMDDTDDNGSKERGWLLPRRKVADVTDLLGHFLVLPGPIITTYVVKEKHSHQACRLMITRGLVVPG